MKGSANSGNMVCSKFETSQPAQQTYCSCGVSISILGFFFCYILNFVIPGRP
jgi:hypothetical protein